VEGSTIDRTGGEMARRNDVATTPQGQGDDAATNPNTVEDNSFDGEASSDEAAGQGDP
jgi:hypothetical protein